MNPMSVLKFDLASVVTLDFETYYDPAAGYTLTKMTTEAYVRDPRFETIGVGVRVTHPTIDCGPGVWFEHEEFAHWAKGVNWAETAVLSHNSQFDHLILSHHYGVVPGFCLDTLSMARALHGAQVGNSLAKLSAFYDVGVKGDEVVKAMGKRRRDFTEAEWVAYGEYCKNDCALTTAIFGKMLANGFPESELWNIDLTIRMFIEPQFLLDEPLLRAFLVTEQEKKSGLLKRIEEDKSIVMSNDKFALALADLGVDPPTKISPTTGKETWAFAKDNPDMQALLEDEVDEVRWLVEARIANKSTINETRTERLLKMSGGGRPMPLQLNYGAAHTFRWGGAGKINAQNFERTDKQKPEKGVIRRALVAPPGHLVVAVDSAQIEARVTAWLAGHAELLEAFAVGRDVYSMFASKIYGRPVDRKKSKEDFLPGFVGKTCFAADTLVLTQRGWVPIVDVELTDQLWDGVEWVMHSGVISQGVQEVWQSNGVAATPGHEILTERGWREWSEALTDPSLFRSALSSATLPSPSGDTSFEVSAPSGGAPSCAVRAGGSFWQSVRTFFAGQQRGATPALKKPRTESGFSVTAMPWPTTNIASGCSTASRHASTGATTPTTPGTSTTARAGFRSILNGVKTAWSSFVTPSLCPVGTSPSLSWTARMSMGGTHLATCDSSLGRTTSRTSAASGSCSDASRISKRRTQVFDLLSAGPRQRFTIWSGAGPLIVHNCVLGLGYSMGWRTFAANMLKGMLGGPPVQFTGSDVDTMKVDVAGFLAGASGTRKLAQVEAIPSRIDLTARIIHCAVAEKIVYTWRDANKPVVDFWKVMDRVLGGMDEGVEGGFGPGECLRTVRHGIRLPNGLIMRYPGLRHGGEDGEEHEGYSYMGGKGGKQRVRAYGGSMVENVVQALSRVIVAEQMLYVRGQWGYRPALFTHDELVYILPEAEAPLGLERVIAAMKMAPDWAPSLPLGAEGGTGVSYGSAK